MTITAERPTEERVTVTNLRSEAVARAARRWMERIAETSDGHWPWPGQMLRGDPVCQVGIDGKPVGFRARRLFWEALVGPLPGGYVLRQTCDYPACVNPACHEALARAEFARDLDTPMGANARKETCVRGHPLSGVGSDVYERKSGGRQCRACDREREREQAGRRPGKRELTVAQRRPTIRSAAVKRAAEPISPDHTPRQRRRK